MTTVITEHRGHTDRQRYTRGYSQSTYSTADRTVNVGFFFFHLTNILNSLFPRQKGSPSRAELFCCVAQRMKTRTQTSWWSSPQKGMWSTFEQLGYSLREHTLLLSYLHSAVLGAPGTLLLSTVFSRQHKQQINEWVWKITLCFLWNGLNWFFTLQHRSPKWLKNPMDPLLVASHMLYANIQLKRVLKNFSFRALYRETLSSVIFHLDGNSGKIKSSASTSYLSHTHWAPLRMKCWSINHRIKQSQSRPHHSAVYNLIQWSALFLYVSLCLIFAR